MDGICCIWVGIGVGVGVARWLVVGLESEVTGKGREGGGRGEEGWWKRGGYSTETHAIEDEQQKQGKLTTPFDNTNEHTQKYTNEKPTATDHCKRTTRDNTSWSVS